MKRKLYVTALMAMLLMCVCALSGCSGSAVTIDLKDYVNVRFEGFNGSGTARVDIDSDAMLPLIKSNDEFTAYTVADNFSAVNVENNGKLSNGDTIKVKVNYSEQMMKNAKITVKNPELTFSVAGLKEKEKLDVFANVEFETVGTSPECKVSVKYNGEASGVSVSNLFEVLDESGTSLERVNGGEYYPSEYFKNGDKVTVKIADNSLEKLREEYEITENSREYTVQSDSKYILAANDLSADEQKQLEKIAEDYVNEQTAAALKGGDKGRDNLNKVVSAASGLNIGTLYAGCSQRLDKLEIAGLNSAYVGIGETTSWGVTKEYKCAYYFYDANVKYYAKHFFDIYDEEKPVVLVVKLVEPTVTSDGIKYSEISFDAAENIEKACQSNITPKLEKLF